MSQRMTWVHTALLIGSLAAGATAAAQTAARGCLELKTVGEVEQTYVDAAGKTATRLVPAGKVVPGDEVIWTITANNICTAPAADVAVSNPIPEHMRYVGDTAFGPGATIEFSLDGNSFALPAALTVTAADGSRRAARADEYSHIRWTLGRSMNPSETLIVRYRAKVL
jgi:uncharacterized repeat protein (TIGR01451 family)